MTLKALHRLETEFNEFAAEMLLVCGWKEHPVDGWVKGDLQLRRFSHNYQINTSPTSCRLYATLADALEDTPE